MNTWTDSLGIKHNVHEPLLKAGPAPAEPPPWHGQFRLLVDELIEHRRRVAAKVKVPVNTRDEKAEQQAEQISRADHLPTIRQRAERPAKPAPAPLRKSLAELADEAERMNAEVQRAHALALIADLAAQAKAGRLDAISAAKLDALRHANATALGLTATGVRA